MAIAIGSELYLAVREYEKKEENDTLLIDHQSRRIRGSRDLIHKTTKQDNNGWTDSGGGSSRG